MRQGRGYVPRIAIFTPILVKDIPTDVLEEISWWNRVTLNNIQGYLGLPLTPLNADLDESLLRLSLAERLTSESGHAIWIRHGYVFEPQRIPIWRAERSGSSAAFLRAYSEGRKAMMKLAEQLVTDGYLLVRQSAKQIFSNALPLTKSLIYSVAPGEPVMEGYKRSTGLSLVRDRLRCAFGLGKCQGLPGREQDDITGAIAIKKLDSSVTGIYPLDISSGSQCMIEVREDNFQNYLLASSVTAVSPHTEAFITQLKRATPEEALSEKPSPRVRRVSLALPTTSKGMEAGEDAVFLRVLLPSLLESVTDSEWASFVFMIYVGYDHGDEYFDNEDNRQKIVAAAARLIGDRPIQLRLLQLPNMGRVALLWNLLYLQALRDGTDYFFQVNDDLKFVTPLWLTYFTETLDANQGFGVVGPADFYNALNCSILTMAMVTPVHYEIFGSLYPLELKDWKTDRWLTYIYQPDHMHCRQDVIANNGAAPTRYRHCEFLSYVIYVEAAKRRIAEWRAQRQPLVAARNTAGNIRED